MRVEDGGATYDGPPPGFDRALEGVDGSTRVIRIVHDRTAFVTLPPDVVSAVLRSRSAGGEYPRHVTLEFQRGREHRVVHAAWAGGVTPGGENAREIGVPHALATLLNIREGEEARFCFGAPDSCAVAESVTVSPLSADDWEAVLGHSEAMEATLLSQIGLAAIGQAVPFYGPGGGKPLSLRVRSITPNVTVARLAPNTELIVEPWSVANGSVDGLDDLDERFAGGIDLNEWFRNYDETKTSTALRLQNPSGECAKILHKHSRSISYGESDAATFQQTLDVPWTTAIVVEKETAEEHKLRHGSVVRVFKYSFEREFDLSRTDDDLPSLFLRVMVVKDEGIVAPQHVALATSAARALEMFQGDYVRIKEMDEGELIRPATFTVRLRPLLPPLPVGLKEADAPIADIFTKRKTLLTIARAFGPLHSVALGFNAPRLDVDGVPSTDYLDGCARAIFTAWMREQASLECEDASAHAVILSSKTPVVFEIQSSCANVTNAIFELDFKYPASERVKDPVKQPVCVPLSALLDGNNVRVELGAPTRMAATNAVRNPAPGVTVWPHIPDDDDFAHIPGESLRAHTEEALKLLKTSLWFDTIKLREKYGVGMAPGILVTGRAQRGRSRLVKSLCKILAEDIKALSCVIEINCAELPQPAVKTLEALRTAFSAAQDRQPSICYFLNLEHICSANEEEDSKDDGDVYHLASIIAHEITELADSDTVMCLATTSEREALAQPLRENEVFDYEFEVCKPAMDARRDIMLSYARHLGVELDEEDASLYAERTDGYDVPDLRVIIDRAIESALDREGGRGGVKILSLDLSKVIDDYVPQDQANLRKSDGARGDGIDDYVGGFETIGGYDDLKEILDEAIALPARHPKIFAQCPLRLPTGVLLFGAPGCGKTAMAKACIVNAKLRSITIKGPELFSKYYGESEGELRRLFRRAQEAAPCALFFDEFDSLVPRRGSTDGGVTDRMVNQFLTLLDGVDSLVGVFVICATSRPDVIDPALLRPGRLDHVLYMPMPDADTRADIMRRLIRDVDIASGVDLIGLARDMDGCSGADLSSFVDECRNCASRRAIKTYLTAKEAGDESVSAPTKIPAVESIDVAAAKELAGKPSLSKKDIAHYDALHAEFLRGRNPKRSSAANESDAAKASKQTYAGL